MFLFYFFGFIGFASPVVMYVINFKEQSIKNKALLNIIFGLKLFIDVTLYAALIFAVNPFTIILFLILNFSVYMLYDKYKNPTTYLPLEEQQELLDLELKSLTEKKAYLIEQAYLNTGEIFKFDYQGEKDLEPRSRNAIINKVYKKHNIYYIDAVDLDINEERTFRVDRITDIISK